MPLRRTPVNWKCLHIDIINFKSRDIFPEYSDVYSEKVVEEVIEEVPIKRKKNNSNFTKDGCTIKKVKKLQKVKWSKIVKARFCSSHTEKIFYKYSYDEDFRVANFCTKATSAQRSQSSMRLYKKPTGIQLAKKRDLVKLCNQNLIPSQHHDF